VGGERDITFERALALVREAAVDTGREHVPVAGAAGRRLAAEVRALADHPPFTNSAMDGFAVRAADTPGALRVHGESAAGRPWDGTVAAGTAARISTGAPLPDGADAVVPRERVEDLGDRVRVPVAVAPGAAVRRRGEDTAADDTVLPAGIRLAAHHLAAAAGAGHAALECVVRPRVALLVSGREVVPVGAPLGPGQVWDVNGSVLPALVRDAGAEVVHAGSVPDDAAATVGALADALDAADVVITTGGVSVGDHDHLRPALARLGVREDLWGVAIRPGHPLWLGRRGAQRVLALPGNPVSAVVCALVFGRPLLGCADVWSPLPLAVDYASPTPRTDLIRCTLTAAGLVPARRQASHDVTSLSAATHIAAVPAGGGVVPAGEAVPALPLPG
jgi:molybdopterin molybdotransferase